MSRKGVIPSSAPLTGSQSESETMEVLRRRMDAAEQDTKQLVDQLSHMGFAPTPTVQNGPVSPFKARTAEPDVLHKNYEALVSRVCKAESALQTMKLSMLRVQADKDLNKKEKRFASDKLQQVAETYECEIKRLNKENELLRKERTEILEMKQSAEGKLKRYQNVLEQESEQKTQIAMEAEDMQAQNTKLQRRVAELREHVARETSLRASLEQSHKTLLARIQEMESIVQSEREDVKSLNANCESLKLDTVRAHEETELERQLRAQMQEQIQHMTKKEQQYSQTLTKLEKEKKSLLQEVAAIKTQYTQLNSQLDQMKQLFEEKQEVQKQVAQERQSLKLEASEKAQRIAQYEAQIEDQQAELALKTQNGQLAAELQLKLREQAREHAQREQQYNQVQLETRDLKAHVVAQETQVAALKRQGEQDAEHWKTQLRLAEQDKQRVLKDKEALLEEVNGAVDAMAEEKRQLETRIEEAHIEIRGLQNAKNAVELENRRLLERVNTMDDHRSSQQQVEQTLKDMVEQKNRLAYDKGKLQTQVEGYQRELEGLANAQNVLTQQRKINATLESKLQKTQTELQDAQLNLRRLESQVEHGGKSALRNQRDFDLAIKSRDEAVKESQRLLAHIEAMEERNKKSSTGVQRNLEDAREDNRKLSATLESVMHSHTRMQQTLETVQQQLGNKDAALADLEKHKLDLQHKGHQQQKEIEMFQHKVSSMETYESTEIEPVRKNLTKVRTDNAKMACSLEALVKANGQLQGTLEGMQDQLEQKVHLLQQLQQAREEDQESHKREIKNYEERIDNFKQQLMKERDKSLKKSNKDVAEVRRQLEDILNKNGELSRANGELRHKITELEYQMKDQKDKLQAQKRHVEHLSKIRAKQDKTIGGYEGIQEQVKELEKAKNFYVKKNKDQAKTVKTFIAQIAELQEEIKSLAQAQIETTAILQEQEQQLSKERQSSEQWRNKYRASVKGTLQESRARETRLESLQREAAQRLGEVQDESALMSTSMHDAQEWFKTRLDTLQDELQHSKRHQSVTERESVEMKAMLEEEKLKAEEISRQAQAMIKASRETVGRLADYAEETNKDATEQLYSLRAQLEAERDNSLLSDLKLRQFQETSLRHTEELARELEYMKAQTALHYDT